jgi:hypothetical protein
MPSGKIILSVHPGIMGRRKSGRKIGMQGGGVAVAQSGADYLFYPAVMQVYTGTEAHFEGGEKLILQREHEAQIQKNKVQPANKGRTLLINR